MSNQQRVDPSLIWTTWTRSFMGYWQSAASNWQALIAATTGNKEHSWENPSDFWKSLWSTLGQSEDMQNLFGDNVFPEIAMIATRSFLDGCRKFQALLTSSASGSEGDASFARVQQELFRSWLEFHEKEVQPLLRVPQVGLTRLYQEKINLLYDRFGSYQAALAEFQSVLGRPLEESLREVQQKIEIGKGENQSKEELRELYLLWIKTLEGHYMELFRSPEWGRVLSRLVEEAASFRISRNEIVMDFLRFLPIPTNRDMDEVYRELHNLKKLVKQMIKKSNQQEPYSQ